MLAVAELPLVVYDHDGFICNAERSCLLSLNSRSKQPARLLSRRALAVALVTACGPALAAPGIQQQSESGARPDRAVYSQGPKGPLNILIWSADQAGPAKPAVLFFHGGGWLKGNASQFRQMCQDISRQNITCLSANYTLGGGDSDEQEAKAALVWVRQHAKQLHISANRVFVGGGSVGGYLALSTALVDPRRQSTPDGLVLFNPIFSSFPPGPTGTLKNDVRGPLPPMVIFHGTADRLSPYSNAQAFVAAVRATGSLADLQTFPGRPHGFFNYAKGNNPDYFAVTKGVIDFINAHDRA